MEDDENMDFSEFDLATHAGVLLDGVGDVKMLKHHREALQGRAKKCRVGKSATMMYSYFFSLCRSCCRGDTRLEREELAHVENRPLALQH